MKIKGNIFLIHKIDNSWIFKYKKGDSIFRIPFYSNDYSELFDGQELECLVKQVDSIEVAYPI